jgi:acetyl esterase/lipase
MPKGFPLMKTSLPLFLILLILTPFSRAADKPATPAGATEIPLWSDAAPLPAGVKAPAADYTEQWLGPEDNGYRVRQVTTPSLYYFPADPAKADGSALVVAPGGGFNIVVLEHEGWNVARRLNADGIAVFVLKYRHYAPAAAFADGRRAIRLVRSRAAEWQLDPQRIGLGGFSAGGRLTLGVASLPEPAADAALDSLAAVSARPDFLMPIYPSPIRSLGESAVVDANFPPTFLVVAVEDNPLARVADLATRLRSANVRFEAHLFASGKHGFGIGAGLPGTDQWPMLFATWLRSQLNPAGGMKSAALPAEREWGQTRNRPRNTAAEQNTPTETHP